MTNRMRVDPVVSSPGRYLVAALAMIAGLIHLGVAPEHFEEAFEFGFMVVVGAAQIAAGAFLITHPSRRLVIAMILGTVAVFIIYAISRTTGLPFGPDHGHPEPVGTIDLMSKAMELILLAVLLARILRSGRPAGHPDDPNASRRAEGVDGTGG